MTIQETLYKQASLDFLAYNLVVHNVGKTEGWKATKFHTYLCEEVQKFVDTETTNPYDILIINTPPQHGKTITVTETLPSWYLGRHPERRVIEISYNSELSQTFGKRNKEKIAEFGEQIFGIHLSNETKSAAEWELTEGGGMTSVGFGGSITGRKGNLVIIDDPIKNASEAKSETYRERIWNEWVQSVRTRTHPGTKIIVIMTRWHEDDLAGRMLAEENCQHINLPCECEDEDDPLGRKIGDSLCPEIGKDNEWMKIFKESYTSTDGVGAWYAMFQGRPVTEGGNILKSKWWGKYSTTGMPADITFPDKETMLKEMDEILMSVDAAFKDVNDPVCIELWGRRRAEFFLIDLINDRLDFVKTIKAIQGMKFTYPQTRQILIEDKANGSATIATLHSEIPGIIPIEPQGGKVSRVNAIQYVIESGNVYLPEKPWVKEFVNQCSSFPNGKHDDMVDAMSQALTRMTKHKTHIPPKRQRTIMEFFGRTEPKSAGKGEKINVI